MKKTLIITVAALIAGLATIPAIAQARMSARSASIRAKAVKANDADKMTAAYITVDPEVIDFNALIQAGAKISLQLDSVLTARFPLSALDAISAVPGVKYVQVSAKAAPMLDVARPEVGIDKVHSATSLERPYTGKGVIIGIVDNGFDYTHSAFYAPDGTLRIKRVWEQGTNPSGALSSPERFGFGAELIFPEQIADAQGDISGNSHGTHVTSIAAGSDTYLDGALLGMAPEADIVLVSMLDGSINNVNISDAIAYIFDYADACDKPCVVNLSLGAHSGPHDGTSTFDAIADRLQGPGRLIVGSAGNHRADSFHVNAIIGGDNSEALRTFIDYKRAPSTKNIGGELEVWGRSGNDLEVSLLVVKTSSGEIAERVKVYPLDSEDAVEINLGRNISGNFIAAAEISPLNSKPHCMLTSNVTSIRTGYAIAVEVTSKTKGEVDIWADNTYLGLTSRNMDGYVSPNGASTICEIGGTASRILTVGAYTSRPEFTPLGNTTPTASGEILGQICTFSSHGPTADGRIKPQVAAPGSIIRAAVSINDNSGSILYAAHNNNGIRDNFYGYMQGTSMSSPLVAGIVATWLEAFPEMTPEQLLEIVKATSRTDEYTGDLSNGSNDWGYGKIDALAGIKESIKKHDSGVGSITADPAYEIAKAYTLADGSMSLIFTAKATDVSINVYNAAGTLTFSRRISSVDAGETVTLDLPAGLSLVKLSTANATRTFKSIH